MNYLILLVGPTCSGKTTLEKALNARGFPSVVSYTTRLRRSHEVDGRDYHFMTKEQVLAMPEEEIVQKVIFTGEYYGSTRASLDAAFAQNNVAVMVVEPTGVSQFKALSEREGTFQVVAVYVDCDYATIVHRLINRYATDTNGHPDRYWERLVEQNRAYHEWPNYTDWTVKLTQVDDALPGYTLNDSIGYILESIPE